LERVPGVDGERRQHREDLRPEHVLHVPAVSGGQVLLRLDDDPARPEFRQHVVCQAAVLFAHRLLHRHADRFQLGGRRHPVRPATPGDPGLDLLLQAADPDHEELVQVRADDGEELGRSNSGTAGSWPLPAPR